MPHLTNGDLSLIEACFTEKQWRGAEICRQFPARNWNPWQINRAIKRYETTGTFMRKSGSGTKKPAKTKQNIRKVTEMSLSQENSPGTHKSQREIARIVKIGKGSVYRIQKSLGLKSVKRLHTPQRTEGAINRRLSRTKKLIKRFPLWKVKKIVFQDEKDFTLQVPKNRQNDQCFTRGKKRDIDQKRLYHPRNKFSLKLMVSAGVSWNGVTKPFFLNPQIAKVTGKYYTNHLRRQLLPECLKLYPDADYYFMQDGASSHTSGVCQEFLRKVRGRRFISKTEWPPHSPDLSVLDYYFWDAVSAKVYEGRRMPFKDLKQLERRIRRVWKSTINMPCLRKAIKEFRPRMQCVVDKNGGPIAEIYG